MKKCFAFAAALLLTISPAGAAVQIVENGILTGATGVTVGSSTYDVSFLDGTCVGLFNGCDAASDFDFADRASALTAAQALLAQVFIGVYDTNTSLTRGCSSANLCAAYVPYGNPFVGERNLEFVNVAVAANYSLEQNDFTGVVGTLRNDDTTPFTDGVYARFTLSSVAAVPEPSSWAMMLMGFGTMGAALRRRRLLTTIC